MKLMRKTFHGNIRKLGFDQINLLPNQSRLTSLNQLFSKWQFAGGTQNFKSYQKNTT
jgi:hypothetical protein